MPGAASPPPSPPPHQIRREKDRKGWEQGEETELTGKQLQEGNSLFSLVISPHKADNEKQKPIGKSFYLSRKVGGFSLCLRELGAASCFWTIAFLLGAKHVIISFNPHNNSLR